MGACPRTTADRFTFLRITGEITYVSAREADDRALCERLIS